MIELKTCDVTVDEQETTISFGRRDDRATVYCNDPTILTKISKVLNAEGSLWALEETYLSKEGLPTGYRFSCPKKLIKFAAKGKVLSEEQKAAFLARVAKTKGISLEEAEELREEEE